MKKKTHPFPAPLRRIFAIHLVVALVVATLYATYARLSERLYFPFERWPDGRARREHRGAEAAQMKAVEANFGELTEALVFRYMRFHKQNRFNQNARKLVYTGEGNTNGFGDRFRGILYAYQLALLTQRVLLIAWQEPFPLDVVFQSAPGESVMYDAAIDAGPLPVFTRWRTAYGRDNVTKTSEKPLPSCVCTLRNPGLLMSNEKVVVVRSELPPVVNEFMHLLQTHRNLPAARELAPVVQKWNSEPANVALDNSIYAAVFRGLLRPSSELIDRLGGMHSGLREIVPPRLRQFRQGLSRGYVAVQARIGHGVGEGGPRFNLSEKGASMRLVAACLAKTAAAEAEDSDLPEPQTFYLATDTPAFSKVFRKEIGMWSRDAIVEEMGVNVTHSAKMQDASPSERENFIDTVADLFFLSAGERLVSLPSGFANLAGFFSDVPHKVIRVEECVRDAASLTESEDVEERCVFGC